MRGFTTALAAFILAQDAASDVIFQTTEIPVEGINTPASESSGLPANSFVPGPAIGGQWLGARFSVDAEVEITSIEIFGTRDSGSGYFGAIVEIDPATGLPTFDPMELEANALESILFDTGSTHSHQLMVGLLELTLPLGEYALIVGSSCDSVLGCSQAAYTESSGVGSLTYVFVDQTEPFFASSYFGGVREWVNPGLNPLNSGEPKSGWYMAINGVVSIPEPGTFGLLCIGLAGMALGKRRKRSV